jgi:hypothetical protein
MVNTSDYMYHGEGPEFNNPSRQGFCRLFFPPLLHDYYEINYPFLATATNNQICISKLDLIRYPQLYFLWKQHRIQVYEKFFIIEESLVCP